MSAGGRPAAENIEDDSELALRGALHGQGLSAAGLNRVRQAVTAEWQQIYGVAPLRRRPGVRNWVAAAVASVIAVTVVFTWFHTTPAPVVATVANGLSGSLRVVGAGQPQRSLSAGAPLRRGDRIESTGPGELRWLRGGIVRVRSGARLAVVNDTDVRLEAGAIYVDMVGTHQPVALRIVTPFGTVEHVGTQFVVSVDDSALAVGVREGAVRVIAATTTALSAGDELHVGSDGVLQRRRLAADDPLWHWTGEPLFAFDPEGRSLLELLQWVSQEKGRPLEFSAEALRRQATDTVLHGSVRGLSVDEAMALMLATTSLQATVDDDRIDVSARSTDRNADRR